MEITGARNHGVRETHVAVFTFPFASHPSVLLTLALKLASAATNGKPQEEINLFLRVAEEDIGLKVSCLVVDAFLWFSGDMADEMNIPWVALWPAGAASLSAHFYTDLIREKTVELKGSVRPEDEIADLIPGLSKIRLGDLPGGVVFGNIESPFSTMLHKMGRALPRATAVPLNSFQDLDPDLTKNLSSKFKNFLNIGPFNLMSKQTQVLKSDDEFSCISWLENKKPRSVAYISFGTVFKLPPHEIVELAEALEETKTPFLWSIRKDSEKHFPQGFLERIRANGTRKVVPWAPQLQVLEHFAIGVFVNHGGWNSVLENGTRSALEQVLSADGLSKRRMEKSEALKNLAHKAVEPNGSSNQHFKTLVDVVTGATL
ncbi:kaempferol 3-O-beta-D-galactosyltransferase-like protein [Tanacetum coccineum]